MQQRVTGLAQGQGRTAVFKQEKFLQLIQPGVPHQDAGFLMLLPEGEQLFQATPIVQGELVQAQAGIRLLLGRSGAGTQEIGSAAGRERG